MFSLLPFLLWLKLCASGSSGVIRLWRLALHWRSGSKWLAAQVTGVHVVHVFMVSYIAFVSACVTCLHGVL